MYIAPAILDEIRARIPVSDIVGRRVKLTRRGREFVGLSPFNPEKTPSFTVNDQKQFYHCFSSGKHGDIFTFLMEVDGLEFLEAVEMLASEAGVELPKREADSARYRQEQDERALAMDALEKAASYFEQQLLGAESAEARAYLDQRGISSEMRARFRIGYAPSGRTQMMNDLTKAGIHQKVLISAGLVISGEDIKQPYDRFRGRVMFPIKDLKGRVIAFGGRILEPDASKAKYLNSSETLVFHKGRELYNQSSARRATHDGHLLVAAEGYMDVISLHQAGFHGAVAPLGTAMTQDQLQKMWRFAPEPILCFDGDKAGRRAADRVIDLAMPHLRPGHSLRFALLPEGEDPDDILRRGGPAQMKQFLSDALPLSDMLWRREGVTDARSTPERRAERERKLMAAIEEIEDETVKRYYREDFRQRLFEERRRPSSETRRFRRDQRNGAFRNGPKRPFDAPRADLGATSSLTSSALARAARTGMAAGRQDRTLIREQLLVVTMVNHPELLEDLFEEFANFPILDTELDRMRREIIDVSGSGAPLDRGGLENHLQVRSYGALLERIRSREILKRISFIWPDAALGEAREGWLGAYRRQNRVTELQSELDDMIKRLGTNITEDDFVILKQLMAEVSKMDQEDIVEDPLKKTGS